LYTIQTDKRAELSDYLRKNGIATGHYYPVPLHLQEAFSHLQYKIGDLPVAEKLCRRAESLPLYPEMTIEQQNYVISSVKEYLRP